MYAGVISVLISKRPILISEMKEFAVVKLLGEQCAGLHWVFPSRIRCKEFEAACTFGKNSNVLIAPPFEIKVKVDLPLLLLC